MGKILRGESEANVSDSFLKDVSNRDQKWNVGPEHRKERETFRGCFGKRTPFLRLRTQLKQDTSPNSTSGYEGERSGPNHWTDMTQGTRNESCGHIRKWTSGL